MGFRDVEVPLAEVQVQDPDGREVRLGELVDRPAVLVVPRYYGCLPCRAYLFDAAARAEEVAAAGGAILAVSAGTDGQARHLRESGIGFPLLVDPARNLLDALDLPRRWWVTLNPAGWWNYARALPRGHGQGRIVEPNQLPGLALLDASATARAVHRGRALGDYPGLDDVLARLRRLVAS